MTPSVQDCLVLLFVAAAAVYMVVRLRRVAAGQSKCACGTKACGAGSPPCGSGLKADSANGGPAGGLPLISPACGQGGCGKVH
jgi:hypothetical protein